MFIYVLVENVSQRYIFETVSLSKTTLGLFGCATFSLFSAVEQCFPLTIIQPWNSIFSAFQLKRTGRLNLDPEGVCTTGSFSSNAVQARSHMPRCPLQHLVPFRLLYDSASSNMAMNTERTDRKGSRRCRGRG